MNTILNRGNEEFWNHLMKGTQVPVTESSSQPNNNPWIPIDLPRRVTSTQFEFVQCVQYYNCCSSCTFLCYSGQSVLFCSRTKTLYQRALIIGSYRSTYTSIVESILQYYIWHYDTIAAHYVWEVWVRGSLSRPVHWHETIPIRLHILFEKCRLL